MGTDEEKPQSLLTRQTHHNPTSIDAFPKAFDAVLILHLDGVTDSRDELLGQARYTIAQADFS